MWARETIRWKVCQIFFYFIYSFFLLVTVNVVRRLKCLLLSFVLQAKRFMWWFKVIYSFLSHPSNDATNCRSDNFGFISWAETSEVRNEAAKISGHLLRTVWEKWPWNEFRHWDFKSCCNTGFFCWPEVNIEEHFKWQLFII